MSSSTPITYFNKSAEMFYFLSGFISLTIIYKSRQLYFLFFFSFQRENKNNVILNILRETFNLYMYSIIWMWKAQQDLAIKVCVRPTTVGIVLYANLELDSNHVPRWSESATQPYISEHSPGHPGGSKWRQNCIQVV